MFLTYRLLSSDVATELSARIVSALAQHGYNADREAVTLLGSANHPDTALKEVLDSIADDTLRITAVDVRSALESIPTDDSSVSDGGETASTETMSTDTIQRSASNSKTRSSQSESTSSRSIDSAPNLDSSTDPITKDNPSTSRPGTSANAFDIIGDITGQSTGTGSYDDFVSVFRDRYERLSSHLRSRVNHRPTQAIDSMSGNTDAAIVGLVNDIRSTKNGHWIVELEDTTGTFPCLVMKDRSFADVVNELLFDECIAIEGTLSGDGEILFANDIHFPDIPRNHTPNTADRHVQAALISDIHVGSQEFVYDAWERFAAWLHTDEAEAIEYLLIAGDMVEGVGVYPDQDDELDIVDIYEQYEAFAEHLKSVPGDMEILLIPGNHDAVRLAEPQPGFDDELRSIMSAHDARISGNPSLVTIENVQILMYHGVSLDEVIAELPSEKASYDEPHKAMYQLLKKRHIAPQFGERTRLAPEDSDHLTIDNIPDIFHTGHVHKLGWGKYHNVLAVNSGCWQAQTAFQRSVNIDPDVGYAPIIDLDTLEMTVRKFV
nr:DNA-directed DNA polymerase II small subunit [Haloquadratum walsbyi]